MEKEVKSRLFVSYKYEEGFGNSIIGYEEENPEPKSQEELEHITKGIAERNNLRQDKIVILFYKKV